MLANYYSQPVNEPFLFFILSILLCNLVWIKNIIITIIIIVIIIRKRVSIREFSLTLKY